MKSKIKIIKFMKKIIKIEKTTKKSKFE